MADSIWLLRHGDTGWTREQRHTGRRDLPLTRTGRAVGNVLPLDPAATSLLEREGSRPLLRLWNLTPSLVRAESLVEPLAVRTALVQTSTAALP